MTSRDSDDDRVDLSSSSGSDIDRDRNFDLFYSDTDVGNINSQSFLYFLLSGL